MPPSVLGKRLLTSASVLSMAKKKKSKKSGAKGFSNSKAVVAEPPEAITESPLTTTATTTSTPEPMNAGQRALAEMRRQKAEEKDAELRRAREILQTDQQVSETPAAIPEKVAQRMGARMLPFVGLPLFGGMGAFVGFWYFATYKNMEFEPIMVAVTTIGLLVAGLLVSALL